MEPEQKPEPPLIRLFNSGLELYHKLTGEDERQKFQSQFTKSNELLGKALHDSSEKRKNFELDIAKAIKDKDEYQSKHQSAWDALEKAKKYAEDTKKTPVEVEAQKALEAARESEYQYGKKLDELKAKWPKSTACDESEKLVRERFNAWNLAFHAKNEAEVLFNSRARAMALAIGAVSCFSCCWSFGWTLYNSKVQRTLAKTRVDEQKAQLKFQNDNFENLKRLAKEQNDKLQSLERRLQGRDGEEEKSETARDPEPLEPVRPVEPVRSVEPVGSVEPSRDSERLRAVADLLLVGVVALAAWGRGS